MGSTWKLKTKHMDLWLSKGTLQSRAVVVHEAV